MCECVCLQSHATAAAVTTTPTATIAALADTTTAAAATEPELEAELEFVEAEETIQGPRVDDDVNVVTTVPDDVNDDVSQVSEVQPIQSSQPQPPVTTDDNQIATAQPTLPAGDVSNDSNVDNAKPEVEMAAFTSELNVPTPVTTTTTTTTTIEAGSTAVVVEPTTTGDAVATETTTTTMTTTPAVIVDSDSVVEDTTTPEPAATSTTTATAQQKQAELKYQYSEGTFTRLCVCPVCMFYLSPIQHRNFQKDIAKGVLLRSTPNFCGSALLELSLSLQLQPHKVSVCTTAVCRCLHLIALN